VACPAGDRWTAPVSTTTAAAQAATTPAAIHAGPRDRDQPRRECRPPPRPDSPAATPVKEDAKEDVKEDVKEDAEEDAEEEGTEDTEAARSSATSSLAVGRLSGCLARHLPTSDRSSPGSPPRSAALLTSRYMSKALDPAPNGPCPQAAYTSTAPRLKMSLGGPAS
jgi:hypothetical protein